MTIITNEMTQAACLLAKEVYLSKISKKEAITELYNKFNMNSGSASDYIVNFKKLMNAQPYKRTFNSYATDYLLTQILNDFGSIYYSNAISAVEKHVEYYEELRDVNLKSIRKILEKHQRINNDLKETLEYPDDITDSEDLYEGAKKLILVNSYERNPKARKKCLEYYGYRCFVCNFSFQEYYGSIGEKYIHVHHLVPISTIKEDYVVDPIKDLRPVCPNCHAMLHKSKTLFTIEELKEKIKNNKIV